LLDARLSFHHGLNRGSVRAAERYADVVVVERRTIARWSQVVNLSVQAIRQRNLNYCRDLPNVPQVRAELNLDRAVTFLRGALIATSACAAALLIGSATKFWLEPSVLANQRPGARERAETRAPTPRRGPLAYSAIFERNLFGSEPISAVGVTAPGARGDLLLRGTAEFEGRGFAIFEDSESRRQGIFEVGDLVFEGPRLVAVENRSATLLRAGRKITVELTEASPEAPGGGTSERNAATEGTGGIRKVGTNQYVVDRGEVDNSIENLSTVVTQMRAVPYVKDGKSVGFRVFNIRSGSLFERMGLQNGDVIQAVNGTELDDPSRALALLDEVQTSDEIRIDLLRSDRPNTLTYSIR
jgi:general secretion pathway protein C